MSCCNPTRTPDYPRAAARAHGWSIASLVVGIILIDPFKIIAGSMPICCLRPGPGGNAKCLFSLLPRATLAAWTTDVIAALRAGQSSSV